MATGSIVNGAGGKKRKRKGDGDTASITGSMRGSKAGTAGPEGASQVNGEGGADAEEEEDDDDADEMEALLEGVKDTEATKKQEKEHERLLMDAMDEEQQDRYGMYRRIRLKRETVRKLVNQTLSQSVPQPVIIAVTSYSKSFLGEIIDRALTIRDEWAVTRTHIPNPTIPTPLLRLGLQHPKNHRPNSVPDPRAIQDSGFFMNHPQIKGEKYWTEVPKDASLEDRLKDEDKGPLTPAHLREALRRYKRDCEGGGAGFAGMSLEGVERTMGRTGGRRLFR
jgi:transcription initiation factor TFIID subunit 11